MDDLILSLHPFSCLEIRLWISGLACCVCFFFFFGLFSVDLNDYPGPLPVPALCDYHYLIIFIFKVFIYLFGVLQVLVVTHWILGLPCGMQELQLWLANS